MKELCKCMQKEYPDQLEFQQSLNVGLKANCIYECKLFPPSCGQVALHHVTIGSHFNEISDSCYISLEYTIFELQGFVCHADSFAFAHECCLHLAASATVQCSCRIQADQSASRVCLEDGVAISVYKIEIATPSSQLHGTLPV